MKKLLYDVETYINYFCVGIKDYDNKTIIFYEISEEKNDLDLIYNFFSKPQFTFLISFNGIHYDNLMIKKILSKYNKYKTLSYKEICLDLKKLSDKIINDGYDDEIKNLKYMKVAWIDIDLFLYWSKLLRISKKISLKSLGIQLGYPIVQELPYKENSVLTINDLPKLREYNSIHDLGILELLTDNMEEEIKLRGNIYKQTGLPVWSMDAPKIASEVLLQDYCNKTNQNMYEVRKLRFNKKPLIIRDILKDFNPDFKLPIFQKLYEDILNSVNTFSQEVVVNHGNTSIKLSLGIGGIHSVNENEQYYSNETLQIVTSDIASLYPNLIINYKCIRFLEVLEKYTNVKTERLIAKKNKDKDKDLFYKLILNSISGLLDMEHSWLYYPEGALKMRLIGQLFLTKSIEICVLNNWKVISCNTDGIEVIVPKSELEKYQQILNQVAKDFNLDFEHENYDKIIYKHVNGYIAKTESGKLKRKGLFLIPFDESGRREIPLGNSCDELVINKALTAYYINNIAPEEFISNPNKYNLHIYDYCKSNKIAKTFTVYHNNEIQQQLNRYYFSKKGAYLFKRKHNTGTFQHVNVGEGVILFNIYEEKSWNDYHIDYNHYIKKVKEIILEIDRYHQLTLF